MYKAVVVVSVVFRILFTTSTGVVSQYYVIDEVSGNSDQRG